MTAATSKQIGFLIGLGKKNGQEYTSADFKNESGEITLSSSEANRMIRALQGKADPAKFKKVRGKIIHYLCLLGYTKPDGEADFDRINGFIRGIGSRNPDKLDLQDLEGKALTSVLYQVEAMYKKETAKL